MSVKEAVSLISAYSADTFGVCSVLFELGGMVVIHDPSGCNSTYSTHDEPRWYDTDSLIFISGLTEMDAVMGNDNKLIDDVVQGARDFSPAFIVLLCTPVPLMMGTDFPGLAHSIEEKTGIPTYAAPTNSMQTYDVGASWAFSLLARHMIPAAPPRAFCCSWEPSFAACGGAGRSAAPEKRLGVNVIGLTPLDFSVNGSEQSIRRFLTGCGFDVVSTWCMGSSLKDIAKAGTADVSLVVSYSGLAAAEDIKRRFGIPYVVGVPIGKAMQARIAEAIRQDAGTTDILYPCVRPELPGCRGTVAIIGESVYSASLAAALAQECGLNSRVYCSLGSIAQIQHDGDRLVASEEEMQRCLQGADAVIADQLYRPICPPQAQFVPLGHEAFSGRLYEKNIPDLIDGFDAFAKAVRQGDERHGIK